MKSVEIEGDGSVRISGFNYKQTMEIIKKVDILKEEKKIEIGFKLEKQ